jgi:hypothetical protein
MNALEISMNKTAGKQNRRHTLLMKTTNPAIVTLAAALLSLGSAALLAQDTHKSEPPPGEAKSAKTHLLETGAEVLQGDGPLNAIHAHLCGFHFYNGNMARQVMAIHYCAGMNNEVKQCIIYDSDKKDARLIGVEYIISEKLFNTLPEDEKKLWHSHRYEVQSGELFAPHIPSVAEKELMKDLVNTYGKTWHFWQVDRGDKLPLGIPQLMMGFTKDGQLNPALQKKGEDYFGVSIEKNKENRAGIPANEIAPGADAWEKGDVFQIKQERLTTPQKP